MARLFGTDGVRGIANLDLTPELAFRLGRAAARVLASGASRPRVITGKDPRRSSDLLEAALTAGLLSAGADVVAVGVVPTPAVAYLTRALGAQAGAMISASHNPAEYNGIKFFSGDGFKLPDAVEDQLEALVQGEDRLPRPHGADVGRMEAAAVLAERYIEAVLATAPVSLSGWKIVVDCANGAASAVAPEVYRRLGAEVIAIAAQPDGWNINAGCGSTHPQALQQAVRRNGAHIGIAHDGDADRALFVDERGELVDGDQVLTIVALDRLRQGRLPHNTVVGTVLTNLGVDQALQPAGGRVLKAAVGDRYVLEEMQRSGAVLGGEQSGHIIFLEHSTTGDGLLTACQLLAVVARSGRPLSELAAQMQRFPQVQLNVTVPAAEKHRLAEAAPVRDAVERVQAALGLLGRVLVRPSGTEPLVRVMVEAANADQCRAAAEEVAAAVRAAAGAAAHT